jgi:hypothetical protein
MSAGTTTSSSSRSGGSVNLSSGSSYAGPGGDIS